MPNTTTSGENAYDHTVDIVRNAIPRMSALRIPITPVNYAVWYEYLTDANKALREEMDELLSGERPITNNEMQLLYERYLEERSGKVRAAKSALSQVVTTLMEQLSFADNHFDDFSSEIGEISRALRGETSASDLDSLAERALAATHMALERGSQMKERLSSLAGQMADVQGELVRSQAAARTDPLTGVYNRLAFQEEIEQLPNHAAADTHLPCLLMIDIDFFKRVNDTHGHLAGDYVLQHVAREIRSSVRGRDIVARYGGEEFAVLLRDTPRSGCLAVAENIRSHLEQSQVGLPSEIADGTVLSVTASIGGALFREGEVVETLVDRADQALYQSKEAGRNRVSWS